MGFLNERGLGEAQMTLVFRTYGMIGFWNETLILIDHNFFY